MRTTIYDPVPLLSDIDRFFRQAFPAGSRTTNGAESSGYAGLQFDEDDNGYTVSIDLPGVKKEDVDLNLEGGVLSVEARRRHKSDDAESRVVFSRSVRLPEAADTDNASARLEDGVLHVTLPKQETARARKLAIE
jgi:HSP20 family protein